MQDYLSLDQFLSIGLLLVIWLIARGADAEIGQDDK